MSGKLARYCTGDASLPERFIALSTIEDGAGGQKERGTTLLPLRAPDEDEVLFRVDALHSGAGFSAPPCAAVTAVKAGRGWRDRFTAGRRFIVFAAALADAAGVSRALAAQYFYAGPSVLEQDEGLRLVPVAESVGYAEAASALVWADVAYAYCSERRQGPLVGGRTLVVYAEECEPDFTNLFTGAPEVFYVLGCSRETLARFGGVVSQSGPATPVTVGTAAADAGGFTDILLLGRPDPSLVEACDKALDGSGLLCFASEESITQAAVLAVGRVGRDAVGYVGMDKGRLVDAYEKNRRRDFAEGGRAWIDCAGSPAGTMHALYALTRAVPPKMVVCTGLFGDGLELRTKLAPLAARKGVDLLCIPDGNDWEMRIREMTGPGFDDIVLGAATPDSVERAAGFLAENGALVLAGPDVHCLKARLSPELFRRLHIQVRTAPPLGPESAAEALRRIADGSLPGGMGVEAVAGPSAIETIFSPMPGGGLPGNTVVFPNIVDMPLTRVAALGRGCSGAERQAGAGGVWSREAEQSLFEERALVF